MLASSQSLVGRNHRLPGWSLSPVAPCIHSRRQGLGPIARLLVSTGWTLIDTFERGREQYVVARRNDIRRLRPTGLSPRERQVLAFAMLGNSNKLIAYELGISASTVGVLRHRAAAKLGCKTRSELLERFRELAAQPPAAPTAPSNREVQS